MNRPYGNAGVDGRGDKSKSRLTSLWGDGWETRQAEDGALLPDCHGGRRLPWAPLSPGDEDAWGASPVSWQLRLF